MKKAPARNLWARAFTYWPQRMTDTQLAALTVAQGGDS